MRLIKAHAYGNDFLICEANQIDARADRPDVARRACDRHRGIGADGLMFVTETAEIQLWNADGSASELSGNGIRCVAAWLAESRGLKPDTEIVLRTGAGARRLRMLETRSRAYKFRAAMGAPTELRQERLTVAGESVTAAVMRVGNPQCVVLGPATPERLHSIAAGLATHSFFPEGTNVELATVESPVRVRILIWERGVGPTEASGTGACAAAVAAAAYGGAQRSVDVVAPGGTQHVEWTDDEIWLTGWAEVIGTIDWRAD
jgi:diaminopimelate epimerase